MKENAIAQMPTCKNESSPFQGEIMSKTEMCVVFLRNIIVSYFIIFSMANNAIRMIAQRTVYKATTFRQTLPWSHFIAIAARQVIDRSPG